MVKEAAALLRASGLKTDDLYVSIRLPFSGSFSGQSYLMLPTHCARTLTVVMLGDEDAAKDEELRTNTLQETGNIILNAVVGSLGNLLKQDIAFSPPSYAEETFRSVLNGGQNEDDVVMVARTGFLVKELYIQGEVLIIFDHEAFGDMLRVLQRMTPD